MLNPLRWSCTCEVLTKLGDGSGRVSIKPLDNRLNCFRCKFIAIELSYDQRLMLLRADNCQS